MEVNEAKSAIKAIYLQSAAMAGYEVASSSPERLADLVQEGFGKVESGRRPEAVANLLKVVAATLEYAQEQRSSMLHEKDVDGGRGKVCPVYPFGPPPVAGRRKSRGRGR